MKQSMLLVLLVVAATAFSTAGMSKAMPTIDGVQEFTHGGGLDRYGCHHDRKRGGYHCH